jgi:hypothetical protein
MRSTLFNLVVGTLLGSTGSMLFWIGYGYDLGYGGSLYNVPIFLLMDESFFIITVFLFVLMLWFKRLRIISSAVLALNVTINTEFVRDLSFPIGVNLRLNKVVPKGCKAIEIEMNHRKRFLVIELECENKKFYSDRIFVGESSGYPSCVLVGSRFNVSNFPEYYDIAKDRFEWHMIWALINKSEGQFRHIKHQGVQFLWIFEKPEE